MPQFSPSILFAQACGTVPLFFSMLGFFWKPATYPDIWHGNSKAS